MVQHTNYLAATLKDKMAQADISRFKSAFATAPWWGAVETTTG
jgi:hypothetical protein